MPTPPSRKSGFYSSRSRRPFGYGSGGKRRERTARRKPLALEPLEERRLLFTGGNIFVTGHDVLDHGGQRGFDSVFLDFLRGAGTPVEVAKAEYSLAVIGTSSGGSFSFSEGDRVKPGYEKTTYFSTVDLAANPALWNDVLDHDALIVLSKDSGDLGQAGSELINAHAAEIRAANLLGMDIYAESGTGSYYDFLPPGLVGSSAGASGSSGVVVTPAGAAIGLTGEMVNGDPFHSRFLNLGPEMVVFDTFNGEVLSAGVRGVLFQEIRGQVFHDADANGVRSPGENGMAGVSVKLLNSLFAVVGATSTDSTGGYDLTRWITTAGTYYVEIAPLDVSHSPQDAGGNDAVDSDVSPTSRQSGPLVVTSTAGNSPHVVDAGVFGSGGPASIVAFAWRDANENGVREAADTPLAGIEVRLLDAAGSEISSGMTDAAGVVRFDALPAGNYQLQFTAGADYVVGTANRGLDDNADSDADQVSGKTGVFTLVAGQDDASRAAGFVRVYEIGGFVWDDADGDGLQGVSETGLPGVTMRLFAGATQISTATTDGAGNYRFANLHAGSYRVEIEATSGSHYSPGNVGGDDSLDSDFSDVTRDASVTLPTAAGNAQLDAGLAPVRLAITEFLAINRSGLRDPFNQFSDWIEITNVGTITADLNGWFLTDRADLLQKFQFGGSAMLAPGDAMVVYASENCCHPTEWLTNFKLGASGEYLALIEPDGTTIASEFSPTFPQQMPDVSYGRGAGGELLYFPQPTPGEPNGAGLATIPFDLVITEFMAENQSTLVDDDGDYADWIEILNAGTTPITLDGWHLTDAPGDLARWTFPNAALNPGEYLVVFASGNDRRDPDEPLHTNFKLSGDGEYLALVDPDGQTVVSEFTFDAQEVDISYGLSPDLQRQRSFAQPTPGAANQAAFLDVSFSVQRGFYDAPQIVVLGSETAGAQIRFTTDGSEPTATTGTVYTGPITVDATTTLRAAAFVLNQTETSPVFTQTYLFLDDVLTQNGAGFPQSWGFAADYAMDGEVVGNPDYHADLLAGLRALPSVSLVADRVDLFSVPRGIYANPNQAGPNWIPPVSVEWLDPAVTSDNFQASAGVRIDTTVGSTMPPDSPKLALRLLFDAPHGEGPLRQSLFGGDGPNELDSLLLHPGFEDSWIHPNGDLRGQAQFRRDAWLRTMQDALGQPALADRFVHVYINGLYWGLYDLIQPPTSGAAAEQFGENTEYDIVGAVDAVAGDRAAWDTMVALAGADLANPARYDALRQYLDVTNLADFVILSVVAGRPASDASGWYAVRPRQAGETFRFWAWDGENVLGDAAFDDSLLVSAPGATGPYEIFNHLLASSEFRQLFADRVAKHVSERGSLADAAAIDDYLASGLVSQADFDNAIVAETARWGDYRRDAHQYSSGPYELYTRNEHWRPEQTRITESLLTGRAAGTTAFLRSVGLYPAIDPPSFGQYGGTIGDDFELAIAAADGAVFYTLDGSDPRLPGGGISPAAIAYDASIALPQSTQVRARARSGNEWSAITEATFFAAGETTLTLTEVMFHPAAASDEEIATGFTEDDLFEFVEFKNTGTEPIVLDGMRVDGGIRFDFAAGHIHVLAPGEHVLVVKNQAAFDKRYGAGNRIAGEYTGNLGNGGDLVYVVGQLGQLIVSYSYSDFDPLTDGQGFSILPETDQHSAFFGGSPGEDDPQLPAGAIVINEISPGSDWIELYNQTTSEIDLSGWFISDDLGDLQRSEIPAGTAIAAGSYLVLYGGNHFTFGLNRRGETLSLSSGRNGTLGGYRDVAPYERAEPGVNLGRYVGLDGSVDYVRLTAATEGDVNAPPLVGPVIVNEIMYHPSSGELEYIELYNASDSDVSLEGWRLTGVGYTFELGTTIHARDYFLVVPVTPAEFTARYNVGTAHVAGPYAQGLAGRGESVTLYQPESDGELRHDRVAYDDEAPWSALADGYGAALGRISETSYGNDAASWTATAVGGTPGRANVSVAATPQIAPYAQDFETGSLATLAGWDFAVTEASSWTLSNSAAHGGAVHLVAGQIDDDDSRQDAVLRLDVSGQSAATDLALDFWALRTGGGEGNSASVHVSGDGRAWTLLGNVLPPVGQYAHYAFDLDQALVDAGIDFDAVVYVRFEHRGTDIAHGFALDDVRVGNRDLFGPNVIAQTPSGVVAGPLSQIAVTFDDPIAAASFTPEDVLITTPSGQRIIPTSVTPSGDLRTWTIAVAAQSLRGAYRIVVGPELTDTAGNPMSQGGATVDGMSVNRNPYVGTLTLGPATAQAFPHTQSFEAGNLGTLPGWSFSVSGTGTWEVAPGGSGGLYQLKADQTSFGPSTQEASLLLDLSEQAASDDLMVDFWITRLGHLSGNLASLYVSGDGTTWRHLHSMSPPLSTPTYFAFDLDAALARFGIAADDDVYLRFRHDGNFANDELFVDNLRVSDIDVFGPRATAFSPSTTVAGPLNAITVTFDDPIDPSSFTASDVKLVGPTGDVVAIAANPSPSADGRTFTITPAAPLTLNGAYGLRIGSAIFDVAGNALNQDGDPTNGETNGHDDYVATLRVGPPAPQAFPLSEGFDGGNIGSLAGWQFATTGSGSIAVTNQHVPHAGTHHLWLGQREPGPSRQEATVALDLSSIGESGVYLGFFARHSSGASSAAQTRLLASGDGVEWFWLADVQPDPGVDAFQAYDLRALLEDALIALDETVYVQFVHSGVTTNDALALDQVHIGSEKPFGPRIVAQSPLAYDGATARFTVTFDEPIDPTTFTMSDVTLGMFNDRLVPASIHTLDDRTFTVSVAASLTAGIYELRIGPDISNVRGIPMNQDADATNGELNGDDAYFATLVVVDRPQSVPYTQTFDAGTTLALAGWTFHTVRQAGFPPSDSLWKVTSEFSPQQGTHHLVTYQPGDCWSNHFAVLALDLSQHAGATDLVLDFYLKRISNGSPDDLRNMMKLFVSGNGTSFTQVGTPAELLNGDATVRFRDLDPSVQDFGGTAGQGDGKIDLAPPVNQYVRYTFDLDKLLAAGGVAVDGVVYVDFHQLSFYYTDYLAFDNINIYRTSGTDNVSPKVVDVSVAGGNWTVPFTQYLTTGEMGTFSFSIPSGTGQLTPLPWGSVNQVQLRFSEDVVVTSGSLSLRGVNTLDYMPQVTGFNYDPSSRTAIWTFAQPFSRDKLLVVLDDSVTDRAGNALDGEWSDTTDTMPSGNGAAGGEFLFRFNVLPGDMTQDGVVGLLDYQYVNNRVGTTAHSTGYAAMADFDGNGLTTATDASSVLGHLFQSLPTAEPTSPFSPGDANGDGRVGLADLLIVQRNFGRTSGVDRSSGDLNGDGRVDRIDVALVAGNFARGSLAGASPEANQAAAVIAVASRAEAPRAAATRLVARRAAVDLAIADEEIELRGARSARDSLYLSTLTAPRQLSSRSLRR